MREAAYDPRGTGARDISGNIAENRACADYLEFRRGERRQQKRGETFPSCGRSTISVSARRLLSSDLTKEPGSRLMETDGHRPDRRIGEARAEEILRRLLWTIGESAPPISLPKEYGTGELWQSHEIHQVELIAEDPRSRCDGYFTSTWGDPNCGIPVHTENAATRDHTAHASRI